MKNKKKGFTVVELVIVIAVIGILSAILIPTFVGLSQKAQDAALQEGMRNAYVAYAADKAESEDLKTEQEVVITIKAVAEVSEVYKLNASNKWAKEDKAATGTYNLLGEYNGYFLYYYEAPVVNP